jgi:hypothetical protein
MRIAAKRPQKATRIIGGHLIQVARESVADDWYIIVTAPCGRLAYDGWWRDSAGKLVREAIAEAKRGAMI